MSNGSATLSQPDLFLPGTWTSATSATCAPTICTATPNVIFSQASAAGAPRCASPGGQTIAESGPAPAPVSRFLALESERATPMSGISGPLGNLSSPSAVLQSSLENRLRARMAGSGSPLYALTWKHWDVPLGLPICALRALGRRISGNGCSGWPTPVADDTNRSLYAFQDYHGNRPRSGTTIFSLNVAAQLAGWPSPTANDAIKGGQITPRPGMMCLVAMAQTAGWAMPTAQNGQGASNTETRQGAPDLQTMAGWAAPSNGDWRTPPHRSRADRDGSKAGQRLEAQVAHAIPGASLNGLPAGTEKRGLLAPHFSLWLQGVPAVWLWHAPERNPAPRRREKTFDGSTASARSKPPATRSTSRSRPK